MPLFLFRFLVISFLIDAFYASLGFFNTPNKTVEITVPITSASKYISAFPTTGNTKIPPCGAISVHLNSILSAPATPEPITLAGIT